MVTLLLMMMMILPQWVIFFHLNGSKFLPHWFNNFTSMGQKIYLNGSKISAPWFKNFTSMGQTR